MAKQFCNSDVGLEARVTALENKKRTQTITLAKSIPFLGAYIGSSLARHIIPLDIDIDSYTVTPNITHAYIFKNASWVEINYIELTASAGRCYLWCGNPSGVTVSDGMAGYYCFEGSITLTAK